MDVWNIKDKNKDKDENKNNLLTSFHRDDNGLLEKHKTIWT